MRITIPEGFRKPSDRICRYLLSYVIRLVSREKSGDFHARLSSFGAYFSRDLRNI
jgi:hypothetical protein